MFRARAILLLTITYLAITSNLAFNNIVMGVIIAGLVVFIFRPEGRNPNPRHLPRALIGLVQYVITLTADLILSGIQVAQIVILGKPIKQGIIAIPTDCQSDLGRALSVHAITVTPGEMVVEVGEDGTMYTHCLDVDDAAQHVIVAQKRREQMLGKIFI